ncbi:MAG: peptidoglycan-binding protein [Acidimicrobiia bacterium]|nr:peptidoglycan-binding protein [Acidimicrobiia bacterium]
MKTDLGTANRGAGPGPGDLAAKNGRLSRRIGRSILLSLLGVAAVAAVWFLSQTDSGIDETAEVSAVSFSEVIRTDLVEETTYDGTLGRPAGDALLAAAQGTVTWLPETGVTVFQGDSVFEIDAHPVILLYGAVPLYRPIARSAADVMVASHGSGTITGLPEVGTLIEQGDVLFEVDGDPIIALYGDTPAYRNMADQSTDLTGPDILQLEEALDALGFVSDGEMTVDGEFTSATADVVEKWQAAVGAEEDGSVSLGEVVFIAGPTEVSSVAFSVGDAVGDAVGNGQPVLSISGPEPMVGRDVEQLEVALVALGFDADGGLEADGTFTAETATAVKAFETSKGLTVDGRITPDEVLFADAAVRVSSRLASVGGPVNQGTPVLAVTGEQTVVTMNLPAADQGILEEGMAVTVELPDGTDVPGTVTSVATVASVEGNETVFAVEVELDDPAAASGLDEAPVDVKVVTDSVENVMAVPVAALLALAEGGYGVEVDAGGGQTRLVAVEPGFFADGFVEVVSDGIQPGDMVIVP